MTLWWLYSIITRSRKTNSATEGLDTIASEMDAARSLENLPVELQLMILERIQDKPTLFTLISTSPRFLQVYIRRRQRIFIAVVCNQIGRYLSSAMVILHEDQYPHIPMTTQDNLTADEAKALHGQDTTINTLIRNYLIGRGGLGDRHAASKSVSLRRGIYNFMKVAVMLRALSLSKINPPVYESFNRSLDTVEVLRAIECLCSHAQAYFRHLSQYASSQICEVRGLEDDPDLPKVFFGDWDPTQPSRWIRHAPWTLTLYQFKKMIVANAVLERKTPKKNGVMTV